MHQPVVLLEMRVISSALSPVLQLSCFSSLPVQDELLAEVLQGG